MRFESARESWGLCAGQRGHSEFSPSVENWSGPNHGWDQAAYLSSDVWPGQFGGGIFDLVTVGGVWA